ncbi:TraX family protein [Paenibacillus thermoaerophilus]|uniref:TraX family protein n=1 Tax=Paenibacillus thermoaerophilus TaxID=1215385 RepID=A0ABW2V422_9BACL|nr:TraX family protein [Paenibacillus thermoaerophilus]TMV18201.1 conjugal transfer protein TraX [Paenibacillus thermoaerophilus]
MQPIAMITMLIDHIGALFFPDDVTWRLIGRIAFPIYAYALVAGYRRTRSIPRYMLRLLAIAAAAQLPFSAAFGVWEINAVGTLLVSLCLLALLDRFDKSSYQALLAIAGVLFLETIPFDYGAYGLALVLIYRYAQGGWMLLLHAALDVLFIAWKGWWIQPASLLPTFVLAYWPEGWKAAERARVPSWVWRSFYPAHLAVLAVLRLAV